MLKYIYIISEWSSIMKVLCIGDIVGTPGCEMVSSQLKYIIDEHGIDFVIANGENAATGNGITEKKAEALIEAGVGVITLGNHGFEKPDALKLLNNGFPIIRPANLPDSAPGNGYIIKEIKGKKIAVINLLGRVFLPPINSPFEKVTSILDKISAEADFTFVDFHAEATSEKMAMGWFLDGKVTGVFGTHTHIQTADERILPGKTAYITDIGMTGPYNSVLGMDKEVALSRFLHLTNKRYETAQGNCTFCGVIIETNDIHATSIKRIFIK